MKDLISAKKQKKAKLKKDLRKLWFYKSQLNLFIFENRHHKLGSHRLSRSYSSLAEEDIIFKTTSPKSIKTQSLEPLPSYP